MKYEDALDVVRNLSIKNKPYFLTGNDQVAIMTILERIDDLEAELEEKEKNHELPPNDNGCDHRDHEIEPVYIPSGKGYSTLFDMFICKSCLRKWILTTNGWEEAKDILTQQH